MHTGLNVSIICCVSEPKGSIGEPLAPCMFRHSTEAAAYLMHSMSHGVSCCNAQKLQNQLMGVNAGPTRGTEEQPDHLHGQGSRSEALASAVFDEGELVVN